MDVTYLLFLVSFICLDTIRSSLAMLCTFYTSNGLQKQKFCKERCCEGPNVRYATVCCYYKRESEIYIGTGMATLIVLTIFLLCFTYICCRRKLLRQTRDYNSRNRNTRLNTRRNHVLPTVSEQVQLPVPPPYKLLPPPYDPFDQSKNLKNEHTPSLPTSPALPDGPTSPALPDGPTTPALPDGPPPAYSPYDTNIT